MSQSPRYIFPSFVIASEIAILTFTTYLVAINYSAYHNDRSLEPASDDASVLSWIQLSSTPSILRLLYGCLCGDLENLPVALYAAGFAWAGLTMLCTRFSTLRPSTAATPTSSPSTPPSAPSSSSPSSSAGQQPPPPRPPPTGS
ncbi:hypothetical protein V2G26_009644 [Clonostachys chloroleuca]